MIISRTPFRISFFGGGTDFPEWYHENNGLIISAAINKYCYISLREQPFARFNYHIRYRKNEEVNSISKIEHPSVRNCFKHFNFQKKKIELVYYADIPDRSGIGSSSSFTVGLVNCLSAMTGKKISKIDLAKKAIFVEQKLIKENVGSQDQTIASFGGFNIIKKKKKNIDVKKINIKNLDKKLFSDSIVLLFTGFSRFSSDINFHYKKNMKKNTKSLSEIYSIAKDSINIFNKRKFDIYEFSRNLRKSWEIKRKMSKYITNDSIDLIYEKALKNGALGGKLLGAGGGGFMCFIIEPGEKEKFIKKFNKLLYIPVSVDYSGSKIFYNS